MCRGPDKHVTDTSNGNPRLPGEADVLREGAVLLGMGGKGKQKDKQNKSSVKRGNNSKKKASLKWGLAWGISASPCPAAGALWQHQGF